MKITSEAHSFYSSFFFLSFFLVTCQLEMLIRSEPEGPSLLEKGDQGAIDMGSHDSVHGADELAANKNHRNSRRVAEQPHESPLNLLPSRVLVQLIHRRIDPHPAEEPLDSMAHAAAAHTEYYHRALRRQPRHPLQWVPHAHPHRHIVTPRRLCLLIMHHYNNIALLFTLSPLN